LHIFDITNPNKPIRIGYCSISSQGYDVTISGNYAYIADGSYGLGIVDISSTNSPRCVGYYDTPGTAIDVKIVGEYAYLADYNSGLRIINISDPYNPFEVGYCDIPKKASEVVIQGNYAFISDDTSGLCIINITDPSNPYKVSYYNTPGSAYGLSVRGNYAYVADGSSGLRIIDITDPQNPFEAGYYDTPGIAYNVAINGDYAFVVDGRDSGLRVINIKKPSHLKEIGYYNTYFYAINVAIQGNCIYMPVSYSGLYILQFIADLENTPDVKLIKGSSQYNVFDLDQYLESDTTTTWTWSSQTTYANLTIISENNVHYLEPLSPTAGQDTVIFSTPDLGQAKSILKYSTYLLNRLPEVWVDDGYAVANCAMDLNFYLIKNPEEPNPAYSATVRYQYAADSERIKISLENNLLYIKPSLVPNQIGSYDTPGKLWGVFVRDKYAYLADGDNGVRILDISNPAVPFEVGYADTPGFAERVVVSGNYAYIADNYAGLRIIDVTNPMLPFEVGSFMPTDGGYTYYVKTVHVKGDKAYIIYGTTSHLSLNGDGYGWLGILDISDPTSPILLGKYYLTYYFNIDHTYDVIVQDNYAYLIEHDNLLRIFDISDPTFPIPVGSYSNSNMLTDRLFILGNYAYIIDVYNGLRIIDISNPSTPAEIGNYLYKNGWPEGIFVRDHYAYLLDVTLGLKILDISNPAIPVEIASCKTPPISDFGKEDIFVSGDYAYLAIDTSGLRIIDIGSNTIVLHQPAEIVITAIPDTTSNDWDKEIIRVYEIANSYGQFSTGSDTSHWYFEPYGDSVYAGVLSWSSSYQLGAFTQSPGQKAKLSQLFTVPYPGWYTAKAKVGTDISEISKQQKVYLYLQEFNQDTEIITAGYQVLNAGNGGFGDASTGKEIQVSFYARNTILGIQLVSINPIRSGVWGSLYFDDIWVYPAEPQVNRCYGTPKVTLVNPSFDEGTAGWILEPYGNARYSGVWTTAYSLLCLTQFGGNKGKASQLFQFPNAGKNASASVWVYTDAPSQTETQKVYLYLYSYDSGYLKIIESGNAVLYPGKWEPCQWQQLQVAYTPMTEYAAVQVVGINPVGNSWATLYFDEVVINQDQDLLYYWDHTLY
jgi:hypothetical protein